MTFMVHSFDEWFNALLARRVRPMSLSLLKHVPLNNKIININARLPSTMTVLRDNNHRGWMLPLSSSPSFIGAITRKSAG